MRSQPLRLFIVVLLALIASIGAGQERATAPAMHDAARAFLAALTVEQQGRATFAFDAAVRTDWHYIPKRERKGLPFKDMTGEQVHLAHVLLSASLSRAGYAKAAKIMSLESLVRELEESAGRTLMLQLRDPFLYYLTIFGEPRTDGNWGWSLEGHHVSLNFTVVDGGLVATAPTFFGAEPHRVLAGPRQGLRVLGAEEDQARALLAALDDDQRAAAILAPAPPRDILSGAQARIEPETPARGLAATAMSPAQRALLRALIDEYIANLPSDLAAQRSAQVEAAGDGLTFAWMGSTEPGIGQGHYYRVQAPTFLIEYDNTQNDANHSHTVWRDYAGDFGRDLLAEHYRRHHRESQ